MSHKTFLFGPRANIPQHVGMIRGVTSSVRSILVSAQEELWTRAVPEQQKLTIQLCRNSLYFLLSGVLIRFFGDQLAV